MSQSQAWRVRPCISMLLVKTPQGDRAFPPSPARASRFGFGSRTRRYGTHDGPPATKPTISRPSLIPYPRAGTGVRENDPLSSNRRLRQGTGASLSVFFFRARPFRRFHAFKLRSLDRDGNSVDKGNPGHFALFWSPPVLQGGPPQVSSISSPLPCFRRKTPHINLPPESQCDATPFSTLPAVYFFLTRDNDGGCVCTSYVRVDFQGGVGGVESGF